MFSYVFMKLLERRPRDYDRRMSRASRGRALALKQAVAEAVPEPARVLEIGCGTGELAEMLVGRGATVLGFDSSAGMVEAATARARDPALTDRFEVRNMGVDAMDGLPGQRFDAVVSTLVFSELSEDERRYAVRQAHRVLRPGGLLVVAAEVRARTAGRRLAQRLVRAPLVTITYLATGSQTRPVADLAAEIRTAGFRVERQERSHADTVALVVARKPGTDTSGDSGADTSGDSGHDATST